MAMVKCENGHHYDERKHTICPYCPIPMPQSEYGNYLDDRKRTPGGMIQCENGHLYNGRHNRCPYCPASGLVQCENGHFYDDRRHTHCPLCAVPGLIDKSIERRHEIERYAKI
jgi:hypothetical protein